MEQQYFVNVLQILDVATERGAWKGAEIEGIAAVRKQTMEQIKRNGRSFSTRSSS